MEVGLTFSRSFFTFILLNIALVQSNDIEEFYFRSLEGLNGFITTGLPTPETCNSVLQCANECKSRLSCLSFHYSVGTHRCYVIQRYVTVVDTWQPLAGVKTFWKLQDACPSTSGYVFLPDAEVCVKVVHLQTKTWTDAQTTCAVDGGHLMIMDTEEKLLAVKDYFLANGLPLEADYSIGAVNQTFLSPTEFFWLNGNPMTFQNWFPGMPEDTSGGAEKCVEFVPDWYHWNMADDTWHWNDITCDWSIKYICQIPMQ